jgi:outer membrane protein insertion porin family
VEIRFEGLRHVPRHAVESVLTLKVGEAYSQEKVRQNAEQILGLGYFMRVEVDPRAVEGGVALIFRVVENPLVRVVRFEGNTVIPDADLEEHLIANKAGRVFNGRRITRDTEALMDYYRTQGYIADIFPEFNPDTGVLVFRILEYRVERIEVVGNKKTRSHAILRQLYTRPGDLWSPRLFSQRDLRALMNLGIFEEVPEVVPDLGSEPGKVVLTLKVKERKTGLLTGGAGYSSRYGLLGFVDISDTNFLGRVEQISAHIEFGGRQSYELHYFDPWLDSHRTTLRVYLFNGTFDRFTSSAAGSALSTGLTPFTRSVLVEWRRGFQITVGRPLSINDQIQLGLRSETVSTERLSSSQVPGLPALPFLALRGDTTRSITLGLIRDTRDYFLDPSRGMRLSLDLELAGGLLGGDNDFTKYILDVRKYWPLGGKTIFAVRSRIGLSSGRVPFSQLYFVGGTDTLRGYQEDRFFGNRMFQAVLFFDLGRAWRETERVRMPSDLVAGYGLGLRVNTPLGPLRLDFGWGKEGTRTHFGFAQLF